MVLPSLGSNSSVTSFWLLPSPENHNSACSALGKQISYFGRLPRADLKLTESSCSCLVFWPRKGGGGQASLHVLVFLNGAFSFLLNSWHLEYLLGLTKKPLPRYSQKLAKIKYCVFFPANKQTHNKADELPFQIMVVGNLVGRKMGCSRLGAAGTKVTPAATLEGPIAPQFLHPAGLFQPLPERASWEVFFPTQHLLIHQRCRCTSGEPKKGTLLATRREREREKSPLARRQNRCFPERPAFGSGEK